MEALTTAIVVDNYSIVQAKLLLNRRQPMGLGFIEIRVWQVPQSVQRSEHLYKYALAYVVAGICVLRYDNERGKGDHRHLGDVETDYAFIDMATLISDFLDDVGAWRPI